MRAIERIALGAAGVACFYLALQCAFAAHLPGEAAWTFGFALFTVVFALLGSAAIYLGYRKGGH